MHQSAAHPLPPALPGTRYPNGTADTSANHRVIRAKRDARPHAQLNTLIRASAKQADRRFSGASITDFGALA